MTHASEDSGLTSAALKAGSCFAIITAPLALFGTHPVDLNLVGMPLYQGSLSNAAPPYLAIAAAASLGIGSLGRRKSKSETQSVLQSNFSADLPTRKISPQEWEESGLHFFLDDDSPQSREGDDNVGTRETSLASLGLDVPELSASVPVASPVAKTPVVQTLVASTSAIKAQEALSKPSLGLEPEIFSNASQDEFVLESWAEAFLSDVPLVAVENAPLQDEPVSPKASISSLSQVAPQKRIVQSSEESVSEPSTPHPSTIIPLPIAAELQTVLEHWEANNASDSNASDSQEIVALPTTSLAPAASSSVVQRHGEAELSPGLSRRVAGNSFLDEQMNHQSSMPCLPAAQAYVGFSHLIQSTARPYSTVRDVNAELEALEQLQSVREQIQSLSAQMEMIQNHLYPQSFNGKHLVALPSTPPKPTYTVSTMESASEQFQFQSSPKTTARAQAVAS